QRRPIAQETPTPPGRRQEPRSFSWLSFHDRGSKTKPVVTAEGCEGNCIQPHFKNSGNGDRIPPIKSPAPVSGDFNKIVFHDFPLQRPNAKVKDLGRQAAPAPRLLQGAANRFLRPVLVPRGGRWRDGSLCSQGGNYLRQQPDEGEGGAIGMPLATEKSYVALF